MGFGLKESHTGLGHSLSSVNDLFVEARRVQLPVAWTRDGSGAWLRCGYLSRKGLTDTAFPGAGHLAMQLSQGPAQ